MKDSFTDFHTEVTEHMNHLNNLYCSTAYQIKNRERERESTGERGKALYSPGFICSANAFNLHYPCLARNPSVTNGAGQREPNARREESTQSSAHEVHMMRPLF